MRLRGIMVGFVSLFLALSASALVSDDLEDLKAAHARALKAVATSDADLWLTTFQEEDVRFDRGAQMKVFSDTGIC